MNGSTSTSNYILPVSPATAAANIMMLSIGSLIAFSANARVCLLLEKRADLQKVPHYLFGSLAVNGVVFSLLNLPSRLALTAIRLWGIPVPILPACYVLVQSAYVCNIINAVTLSLMAIDRQDCVLRPFKRRMARHNITKVIAVSWIGTMVLTSPIIFKLFSIIPKICKVEEPIFVYITILSSFFNVASVMIIVVTALRIVKRLRSSPLPESNNNHRSQENKLIWMTYKICGVFLVSKLPILVYFPVALFLGGFDHIHILPNTLVIALLVTNIPYVVRPGSDAVLHMSRIEFEFRSIQINLDRLNCFRRRS